MSKQVTITGLSLLLGVIAPAGPANTAETPNPFTGRQRDVPSPNPAPGVERSPGAGTIYVHDRGNERIVRATLGYQAEETLPLP